MEQETQRKKAALRRQAAAQAEYALFEEVYDAVFVEAADGDILYVNAAACRMLQYERAELLALNVDDLLPEQEAKVAAILMQQMSIGESVSFTGNNRAKDGGLVLIEVRVRRVAEDRFMLFARPIAETSSRAVNEERQEECLAALHEIGLRLLAENDVDALLQGILRRTAELFGTPDGSICLKDAQSQGVVRRYHIGRSNAQEDRFGYYEPGEGLIGKVFQTGEALLISDYPNWPGRHPHPDFDKLQTVVGIPLKMAKETIGVICLDYFDAPREFNVAERLLLRQLAQLASLVLVKAENIATLHQSERLLQTKNAEISAALEELMAIEEELRQQFTAVLEKEDQISRQNMVLSFLHKTALSFMHHLDIAEILDQIMDSALGFLGTQDGWIALRDETSQPFTLRVARGGALTLLKKENAWLQAMGEKISRQASLLIEEEASWLSTENEEKRSVAAIPLLSGGQVVGFIGIVFANANEARAQEASVLLHQFGELASLAVDNARLTHSFQKEIEARRQSEAALRLAKEESQAILQAMPDPILLLDKEKTIVAIFDPRAQLRLMDKAALGRSVLTCLPKEAANRFLQHVEEAAQSGTVQQFEDRLQIDGETIYYDVRVAVVSSERMLAVVRNVTQRREMERQLRRLSMQDSLTGLYNRTVFESEMKAISIGSKGPAALMICDVDGLKLVNDSLGHATGDQLLRSVATIFKQSFEPHEIVARIGGDEIAVLLPFNTERSVENACTRIQRQLQDYNQKNPMLPISLSIGFAVSETAPPDMDALFREADHNMYREKLHRKQSTRSAIVQAMMKALEARDFITEGHGERLQEIMLEFAAALGLSSQQLADIRLFAQFHDIGKVGIPDHILFKPGGLTEAEWTVMRQHAEIGHRIAQSAADLDPIADWILKHHEWWNGQGYPFGLSGEKIPLPCRMLGIVDAYDAMTNDRPYRKALTSEQAVAELRRHAGTQFDPALVEPFVALIEAER
ncbi:HD domain-containing phosphohydrolase [Azotosporobacter soli]|uniref:HD domain-containing phosphohydrolase n=1 Tax=Azotosporobacter soli TaxID=3055040 RepID=UPI0031FEF43E